MKVSFLDVQLLITYALTYWRVIVVYNYPAKKGTAF